jgi:HEAT repeat protein
VFLLSTALLISQAVVLSGQNSRLPSVEEELQRHGIDLTEASLVAALANEDGKVRGLAAQRLADVKATNTIPAIEEALSRESQPLVKANIAYALAQLGDSKGRDSLEQTCQSGDVAPWFRMFAAQYLLTLGVETCQGPVLDLLSGNDDEGRAQALSLLPRFHDLDAKERVKMLQRARLCLLARTPAVRMAASQALRELGGVAAIPYLERAITAETEDAVRSWLQADLVKLQKLQQQNASAP